MNTIKKIAGAGIIAGVVAAAGTAAAVMMGAGAAASTAAATAPAVAVGEQAPDFHLADLDGNDHYLSSYLATGNIVVLEWYSPMCPWVVKHYENGHNTMNDLVNKYEGEDVVWLRVNSAADTHKYGDPQINRDKIEKWNITTPMLMDAEGTVGKMYQATNTPHMYVIGSDGLVAYAGAIDNDVSTDAVGDVNYVEQAVDALLAGETITTSETQPYGCSIKFKQ